MAGIVAPGRGAAGGGVAMRRARAAHPWQRGIALAALILPLPPVVEMLRAGPSPFALIAPVLLLAAPPALRAHRARFTTSCAALAVVLPGWSVFGGPAGAWVFLPSSLLLVCASFADPRAHPTRATVSTFAAVAIGVVPAVASLSVAVQLVGG